MANTKKNLKMEDLENVAGGVVANKAENLSVMVVADKINAIVEKHTAANALHTAGVNALLTEANELAAKCGIKPFANLTEAKQWAKKTKSPMNKARKARVL